MTDTTMTAPAYIAMDPACPSWGYVCSGMLHETVCKVYGEDPYRPIPQALWLELCATRGPAEAELVSDGREKTRDLMPADLRKEFDALCEGVSCDVEGPILVAFYDHARYLNYANQF